MPRDPFDIENPDCARAYERLRNFLAASAALERDDLRVLDDTHMWDLARMIQALRADWDSEIIFRPKVRRRLPNAFYPKKGMKHWPHYGPAQEGAPL